MGSGIVDDNRLAKRVHEVGKIAAPLRLCRHKAGIRLGGAVACPLVSHKEAGPARQQMWNPERTTESGDAGDPIVGRLRCIESAERVGAGVECGVVQDGRKSPGIEASAVAPSIAKRLIDREP
jgi:hypothetical protein